MADFPNILQRDYSLKPHSKLSPMNSPRSGAAGFFSTNIGASRVGPMAKSRSFADGTIESASNFVGEGVSEGSLPFLEKGGVSSYRASPLGKAVEEPFTASAVDYDDVFGGPPRYATSMFSSQSGALPAMDEIFRSPARVPSFRSSNLPVFELPVFGDEVFGVGGIACGPRPAAVAYEDIFSEAGTGSPYPVANLSGSSLTGVPRSKPSSRSSSRRISPVHSAASADNTAQDSVPTVTSSAEPLKARSIAGKFIRRCSFSSFSSYDESGGKPMDSPFAALKPDLVALSVPSSPPCAGLWDRLKRPVRSNSGNSIRSLGSGFDVEVDDVFGGFPQRRSLLSHNSFSGRVQCKAGVNNTCSLKTYGAKGIEKPFTVASGSECRVSPATVDKLDGSGSIDPTIPSSPSSTDEQELNGDFIEIRMDRQNDSVISEKSEGKAWVTVNDVSLSTRPTCKPPPARPPPAPATQLKFKTWKDWASEFPVSHSASFSSSVSVGSTFDSFPELSTAAASTVTAEREESADGEGLSGYVEDWVHTISNSVPEQPAVPAAGKKTKARSAKEAVEAEERELQAMLVNAWKLNEKREMEKQIPEPAQETREASEEIETELHWKEWRKRLNRQFKASQPKPEMQVGSEVTETDTHLKEWKKCPGREKTEGVTKDKVTTEEPAKKIPTTIVVSVQVQDKFSNIAVRKCPSGLEESVSREEMVKIVTDDVRTTSSVAATEPSPSGRNGTNSKKTFPEDVAGAQERSDLTAEEQSMQVSNNPGTFTSDQTSVNGGGTKLKFTEQNFVQDGKDREELLHSEETEDLEFSAGDISFSNGFEKIEGESLERRRSRWQRHVRARERVAKALEEKKQRDAEVQREQAEKQQLAEVSDHQIKRWATGKEGNLRALLSNLQHVLWSDSGWQPIPLTDLIEGAAVKKAYRKATLFVHPDKVQQKGATVQQKYVAERVFDILKEAWKTYSNQDLF